MYSRGHMISRIWHGWTTLADADAYEALLQTEIFVGIQNRNIPAYRGIELLRRDAGDEVEFVTLMRFDSLEAVRLFAGDDYEAAVVPRSARSRLAHFDACSPPSSPPCSDRSLSLPCFSAMLLWRHTRILAWEGTSPST